MRATSDSFPVALTLTAFVLMFLGQSTYEQVAEAWIIAALDPWLGGAAALLAERLVAVTLTAGIAVCAVSALYFRALRELGAAQAPRNADSATKPDVRPCPQRDVWLYDAICRIFLGRWEHIGLKRGRLDLDQADREVLQDLVTRHIRQLAAEGTLPIWGRKQSYWALWEPVPPEYWRHHQVDFQSFLEADPKMLHALPCSGSGTSPALGELMTSRASVDAFCESVEL
ncbi:MAG TPA: hypothetical protein VKW08_17370 [Xanthobacteraceae bacterium]|nr:hypothetical protein [Xanthobacteraceae bacterium]